ncbi:MAG TPA: LamG domain-containing protein [Patescibacteria group bacterium]|nr:LamG domain-containing protein [Patescibacteria group bacterium]
MIKRIFNGIRRGRRTRLILAGLLIFIVLPFAINTLLNINSQGVRADTFLKFDEGYGTSSAVNDSNGAVSAGSITGGTWKTEDLCFDGKCLYFDGNGDFVSFADDADLDFAGSDSFSLMGWFRHAPFTPSVDIDHETGDTSQYTSLTDPDSDLSVTAAAAQNGTNYGLAVQIDDTTATYGRKDITANTSGIARYSFYFDINNLTMSEAGDEFTFANIYNSGVNSTSFVNVKRFSGVYTLRAAIVDDAGAASYTSYYTITDAPHYVEVELKRASTVSSSDGTVQLWIDGVAQETKTGVDNYDRFNDFWSVRLGAVSSIDAGTSGTFYVDELEIFTGTPQAILAKYEATEVEGGYKVYLENNGRLDCGIDNENTYFPSDSASTNSSNYDDNRWHHFACVKNGTTSLTLYSDGNRVGLDDSITSSTLENNNLFYIGIDGDGAANDYQGFIDEVKIYRSAKTATEVKGDYVKGSTLGETSASFLKDQSPLSDGLVGYWKMDEASGDAADSSGNGVTLTNQSTVSYVGGKFGNSIDLVPASTDYFSTATDINGIQSISFWVYPDDVTANYFISYSDTVYISVSSGTLAANGFTGTFYVNGKASTTLAVSTWQLVTVTFASINAADTYVGRVGTTANYMDGRIDEVRFYTRALSPGEITNLYNWAPGPIAELKFDEGTGETLYDSSGNGYSASAINGNTWVQGKYSKGIWFDGSADYINVSTGFGTFSPSGATSISAWVNSEVTDSARHMILSLTGTNTIFVMNIEENNNRWLAQSGKAGVGGDDCSGTDVITNGTWYHVTGVFADNKIKLYVNGSLVNTCDYNFSLSASDSTNTWHIGNYEENSSLYYYWKGIIDNPKVYNYARTQAQIIEDMNAGHPAPGSPIGSSVAHWKFDEGGLDMCSGLTNDFCDSSLNANDLAFSTTTGGFTNSGKFGRAFNGDGAVWASRADDSDFDVGTDSFTISFWMKSDNSGGSGTQYIVNRASATIAGFGVYGNSSGNIVFGVDDDTSWGPDATVTTTSNLYNQSWHNIVAVKTTTSKLEIYVDGVLNNQSTASIPTGSLSNDLTIYLMDRDGANNGDEFIGDLDETQIFLSALTADQVKVLYNQGSAVVWGATSTDSSGNASWSSTNEYCPPGQGSTCTAPIVEWNFDENTGQYVYDISGNNVWGCLEDANCSSPTVGTEDPKWFPGKIGSALSFDDTDDAVFIPDNATIDIGTSDFSIEAWIYLNDYSSATDDMILNKRETGIGDSCTSAAANGYAIVIYTTDELAVDVCANPNGWEMYSAAQALPAGGWHHVVAVINRTTSTNSLIYLDGMSLSVIRTGTMPTATIANTYNIFLGAQYGNGDLDFNGKIDQMKIYNYIRTPAQVAWDYNRGKSTGWWKMDENTGTTTNDSSGNAYHSQTFNGATTWTTGKYNTALTFDGTDDNVRITEGTKIDLGATTDNYSVSAWFKTTTNYTTNPGAIVAKDDGSGVYPFSLQVNTSEQPCIVMNDGSARTLCGTSTVNDGNWHFITGVRDVSGDTTTLYIDAIRVNYQTDPTTATMVNDDNVSIGNSGAGSYLTNDFNGQIDDVKLWNYALTIQQIRTEYTGGTLKFGP